MTEQQGDALERFLAQCEDRAAGVVLALRVLVRREALDWVLQAELCWEVHRDAHWQKVENRDGRAYPSEEAFWEDVLELRSWRSVARRLVIGRVLGDLDSTTRQSVRESFADLGVAKSAILAQLLTHWPTLTEVWPEWVQWRELAQSATPDDLQRAVSDALAAKPRGRSEPGRRFAAAVLGAMPDLDTRTLAEEFFATGARVVGSDNPVAVQVAAMQECLAEWRARDRRARDFTTGTGMQ